MKTLKEIVIADKCRKGKRSGINENGAYWLAFTTTTLTCGGDGIGQSSSRCEYSLDLRHHRNGEVKAVICIDSWHQNTGTRKSEHEVNELLDLTNAEDLIVALLTPVHIDDYGDREPLLEAHFIPSLTEEIVAFGLPAEPPSPDEEASA